MFFKFCVKVEKTATETYRMLGISSEDETLKPSEMFYCLAASEVAKFLW
jgi:hypothetical protein